MTTKSMEMMKKIIEEKKKKSAEQGQISRPSLNIGSSRKAFKKNKRGGLFDK